MCSSTSAVLPEVTDSDPDQCLIIRASERLHAVMNITRYKLLYFRKWYVNTEEVTDASTSVPSSITTSFCCCCCGAEQNDVLIDEGTLVLTSVTSSVLTYHVSNPDGRLLWRKLLHILHFCRTSRGVYTYMCHAVIFVRRCCINCNTMLMNTPAGLQGQL